MKRYAVLFLFALMLGCGREPGTVLSIIENDAFDRAERIVKLSLPDKQAIDGKALYADAVLPGWMIKAQLPVAQLPTDRDITLYLRLKPHWRGTERADLSGGVWDVNAGKKVMRIVIPKNELPGRGYSLARLGTVRCEGQPLNFYLSLKEESFNVLRGISIDRLVVASGDLSTETVPARHSTGRITGHVRYATGTGVLEVPILLNESATALTRAGGRYEIAEIEPGEHTVTAWLDPLNSIEKPVIVEAGKSGTVDFTITNSGALPKDAERRLHDWVEFHHKYPNVIAHNLWDEPSSVQSCWAISLQAQAFKKLDPSRRTMFVQNRFWGVIADLFAQAAHPAESVVDVYPYARITDRHWFEVGPESDPNSPAPTVPAVYWFHRKRSPLAWTIPQAFHSANIRNAGQPRPAHKRRMLEPNELRWQAMLALATGQRGFIWFVYNFGNAGVVDAQTLKPNPVIDGELRKVVPVVRRVAPMLARLQPQPWLDAPPPGRLLLDGQDGNVEVFLSNPAGPKTINLNATSRRYDLISQTAFDANQSTVTLPAGSALFLCDEGLRQKITQVGNELRDTSEFPVGIYMLNAVGFSNDQTTARQDYYRRALADIASIGFNTVHTSGLVGTGYDDRDFVYREAAKHKLMVIVRPRGISELFKDHFGHRGTHYDRQGRPFRPTGN